MALFSTKHLALALPLLVTSVAGAQATPAKPACDVGESATGNAARATLSVNLVDLVATLRRDARVVSLTVGATRNTVPLNGASASFITTSTPVLRTTA